jgi:hypothetical protein
VIGRWASGAVALGALLVLLLAAGLSEDPDGHGTHTQLGMPACGWAAVLDTPCPTCGMTTAFSAAADARVVDAFLIQPLGSVLALLCAAAFWGGIWGAVTGDRIGVMFLKLLQPRLLWSAAGAAAAAWAFKVVTW